MQRRGADYELEPGRKHIYCVAYELITMQRVEKAHASISWFPSTNSAYFSFPYCMIGGWCLHNLTHKTSHEIHISAGVSGRLGKLRFIRSHMSLKKGVRAGTTSDFQGTKEL